MKDSCWRACWLCLVLACNSGEPPPPQLQSLRLPTGALLTPNNAWLMVVNSNLDQVEDASTLVGLDLEALDAALTTGPLLPGDALTKMNPCRRTDTGAIAPIECEAQFFIKREHATRIPTGAGNIALDLPAGPTGPMRLLVPSGISRTVTWVDVLLDEGGLRLDCGQVPEGDCDSTHTLERLENNSDAERLPKDPARIFVDSSGFRYAYLPHLLGGALTLIALDGEFGPKITDIVTDFYPPDPDDNPFAGGFAVAQRACDPGDSPTKTMGCSRPLLYTTYRFRPDLRSFSVLTGLNRITGGGTHHLYSVNKSQSADRPFLGDLEFEDPEVGERLLVVHTTPPSLTLVDTSLNDERNPVNRPIASVTLCRNPNVLAVYRPTEGERLALVSCFSDDQVAVVALGAFQVIATVEVDDGPNELVVDDLRRRLYVINTLAGMIDLIDLDRLSPDYLRVVARVGLGD